MQIRETINKKISKNKEEKRKMKTKKGISLIVLVITIIVMIIIAAAIIIALDNSNVINRANEAVDSTNIKEVQYMASLIWAEAYLDEGMNKEDITKEYIIGKLQEEGIDTTDYDIIVESNGVGVNKKEPALTLGSLITGPSDYGKTVDYTVTVNEQKCGYWDDNGYYQEGCLDEEVTYTDWQVFYETDQYVFLIAKNALGEAGYEYDLGTTDVTNEINNKYNIFKLADNQYTGFVLTNNYSNNKHVASLIANYDVYANREYYGSDYVIGAIGSPTIELLAAGYNAYHNLSADSTDAIKPEFTTKGYSSLYRQFEQDGIYFKTGEGYFLASPSSYDGGFEGDDLALLHKVVFSEWSDQGHMEDGSTNAKIRPVVCLSANIPAELGTGDIDFSLVEQ